MREVEDNPFRHRKRSSNPDLLPLPDFFADGGEKRKTEAILARMSPPAPYRKDMRANFFARMYLRHLNQVFEPLEPGSKPRPVQTQVETYKRVLETYRRLSMQSVIKNMLILEDETWWASCPPFLSLHLMIDH